MVSNPFIFAAAGFEITASILAYAMVFLAKYPQRQERLLKEVDSLVSATGQEPIAYTTVPRAIQIVAFILETVRLYSSVSHVR